MTNRSRARFEIYRGFSVGVVLTIPPFPYERPFVEEPLGLPVMFDGDLSAEDRGNLHYCEVGMDHGALVTTGIFGLVMVATGIGPTIELARERANRLADRVLVPNVRYRRDIGTRLLAGEWDRLERLGLLDEKHASISGDGRQGQERNA
jgi:phosphoribosylamine--glycine ligase